MKWHLLKIARLLPPALLLCMARPTFALWSIADVTANGVYGKTRIAVKITDREQFKEFEVTFAPPAKEFPAYLDGRLSLMSKNEQVALVSVSANREKGVVTYLFSVTPESIDKSTFEIYSRGIASRRRKEERGGVIYALKLKALASSPSH